MPRFPDPTMKDVKGIDKLREKFIDWFTMLPTDVRQDIAVFELYVNSHVKHIVEPMNQPFSLNVIFLEVQQKTQLGDMLLKKLQRSGII